MAKNNTNSSSDLLGSFVIRLVMASLSRLIMLQIYTLIMIPYVVLFFVFLSNNPWATQAVDGPIGSFLIHQADGAIDSGSSIKRLLGAVSLVVLASTALFEIYYKITKSTRQPRESEFSLRLKVVIIGYGSLVLTLLLLGEGLTTAFVVFIFLAITLLSMGAEKLIHLVAKSVYANRGKI